jgi:Ca-activated chloride channel homolog
MKMKALAGAGALAAAAMLFDTASTISELQARSVPGSGRVTQGSLLVRDDDGRITAECPLKRTDVKADISGFLARVTVTQEFENTAKEKIEAVYVFPLPHKAAVDNMTMHVGDRVVKGLIKRREEARAIYDTARNSGKVASLLDQERPNIFTQHVANIAPGEKVKIVISYVETLKYEAGAYEFVFPMVVGPRYIPGTRANTTIGGGWAYDTDKVPDASRITPYVAKPGTRAGHDISVEVSLDAGVPLQGIAAATHEITTERPGASRAVVRLKNKSELPNKDFILKYDVAGGKIADAVLTHKSERGGFFTLFLQPPDKVNAEDVTPKELVFVLDTSGSMSGFPIEKAKETMRLALDGLNPQDTFNLITFSGDTHVLFPQPVAATRANLQQAQHFLQSRQGSGGTEMMKAIRAALAPTESQKHVRIVCFMTDGYVGNEAEIIADIKRYSNARVFSFGIGSSVNRYLLDKMAEAGRGEVEYVTLNDDGSTAAKRFHERIRNPLLTDIQIEWNGLPVSDVYPSRVPDLFDAKPIVLTGRYNGSAKGTVRIRARYAGNHITREIPINLPAAESKHDVLATLWARTKIDTLMHDGANARDEITQLGLDYRLMTPFTSFVAVEETMITEGGVARRVDVPVELPEGVSYEGVFGGEREEAAARAKPMTFTPAFIGSARQNAPSPLRSGSYVTLADKDTLKEEVRSASKIDPAITGLTGEIRVTVLLRDNSPDVIAQLKKLGLTVIARQQSAKVVIGRISADKVKQLAELAGVRYIALVKN